MGLSWSSISSTSPKKGSRKRRWEDAFDCDEEVSNKRIKGTSKYIYEHMFLNGESSDVEVHAAGKVWKLHKVYLKQSPFFKAMFDGKWSDSQSNVIDLAYEDPNISVEALDVCLGSFYDGKLRLTEKNVSGVSAAATLLCLDEICAVCEDFMKSNLEYSNVLSYYTLACDYGLVQLKSSCLSWLRNNLMILTEKEKMSLMSKLEPDMVESLVSSPEFFICFSEYDAFLLLLKWVYVRLHNDSLEGTERIGEAVMDYFLTQRKGEPPFLTTSEGHEYIRVFRVLHFYDLLKYREFAKTVEDMCIFPKDKLLDGYRYLWLTNIGPNKAWIGSTLEVEDIPNPVTEEVFWRFCSRGGRVLRADERHSWRWPTFHFGVDLVFTYHNRRVYVARSGRLDSSDPTIYIPLIRTPFYRLMIAYRIFSLDSKGLMTQCIQSEEVKTISLSSDSSYRLVQVPSEMTIPIYVQMHVLTRSPPTEEGS